MSFSTSSPNVANWQTLNGSINSQPVNSGASQTCNDGYNNSFTLYTGADNSATLNFVLDGISFELFSTQNSAGNALIVTLTCQNQTQQFTVTLGATTGEESRQQHMASHEVEKMRLAYLPTVLTDGTELAVKFCCTCAQDNADIVLLVAAGIAVAGVVTGGVGFALAGFILANTGLVAGLGGAAATVAVDRARAAGAC